LGHNVTAYTAANAAVQPRTLLINTAYV